MQISILPITTVASLGNTSNADQGIRWLYNKRAKDVIPKLEVAVNQLGTSTDSDYWKATPGNAGHALNILLYWAKMHPNYVFEGTT